MPRTLIILLSIAVLLLPSTVLCLLIQPLSVPLSYTSAENLPLALSLTDFLWRSALIVCALLLVITALITKLILLFSKPAGIEWKLAGMVIFIFIFLTGWKNMPYLANGLYFIFQAGTSSLYDPKEMIPMIFMGEFWRLPVIVITPLLILFLAFNIIRMMGVIYLRGINKAGVFNLIFTLLSLGSFFITPHYFYWLFD